MRLKAVLVCSFAMLSAGALLVRQGTPPPAPPFPPQTISLPTFTSHASVAGTSYSDFRRSTWTHLDYHVL